MRKLFLLIPIFILSCAKDKRQNYSFKVKTTFNNNNVDTLKFEGHRYYISTNDNFIDAGSLIVQDVKYKHNSIASGVKSVNLISKDSIK